MATQNDSGERNYLQLSEHGQYVISGSDHCHDTVLWSKLCTFKQMVPAHHAIIAVTMQQEYAEPHDNQKPNTKYILLHVVFTCVH